MLQNYTLYNRPLAEIKFGKVLINTINAHSYNTVAQDTSFKQALLKSDVLLPDGVSVVWATRFLTGKKIEKVAGADLFFYEMERVSKIGGKCFFLGSTDETLKKIKKRAAKEYPSVEVFSYSPPYKPEFSKEDNLLMIEKINEVKPDVLFVGMTAPKQEKWAAMLFDDLEVGHVCCVGAVFDFYAGTVKRAPQWMINFGLEWLYRLSKEPGRLWRRYLIGNFKFVGSIFKEKMRTDNRVFVNEFSR